MIVVPGEAVIVRKPADGEVVSKSGFVISLRAQVLSAIVVASGLSFINTGDTVHYFPAGQPEFTMNDEPHTLVHKSAIIFAERPQ